MGSPSIHFICTVICYLHSFIYPFLFPFFKPPSLSFCSHARLMFCQVNEGCFTTTKDKLRGTDMWFRAVTISWELCERLLWRWWLLSLSEAETEWSQSHWPSRMRGPSQRGLPLCLGSHHVSDFGRYRNKIWRFKSQNVLIPSGIQGLGGYL